MKGYKRSLLLIIGLIALTSAALAFMGPQAERAGVAGGEDPVAIRTADGLVSVRVDMVQDKVLQGSNGEVAAAVTLTAAQLPDVKAHPKQSVDLVIVLDRSGSMQGEKIGAARQAVNRLIDRLTPGDRLALVTYSNGVQLASPLVPADADGQGRLRRAVNGVFADGGTNLGGGLQQGIDLFVQAPEAGRLRKVILISDGLANQGITDPGQLGRMAGAATDHHFAVSTVGVGLDFNELLMTTIADHGTGRYYFMEDPLVFARVFEKEFQDARQVAAAGLELRIPLENGVRLVDAGGYPIRIEENQAVIHPGSLVAGQERKLFLTFRVPTDVRKTIRLGSLQLRYQKDGQRHALGNTTFHSVACVPDEKEVLASVDKETWSQRVVADEFSQLKARVADAVRRGDAHQAEETIQAYEARNVSQNAVVGSLVVTRHLEEEVKALRDSVADTFEGAPAEVMAKQKKQSKALQYESYQKRRSKN